MLSDEGQMRAAIIMRDAAETAARAAATTEEAARRIAALLENGYGGNGCRLIELLEQAKTPAA